MVNLLIEKGANIYAEDSDGLSPLDYARRNSEKFNKKNMQNVLASESFAIVFRSWKCRRSP